MALADPEAEALLPPGVLVTPPGAGPPGPSVPPPPGPGEGSGVAGPGPQVPPGPEAIRPGAPPGIVPGPGAATRSSDIVAAVRKSEQPLSSGVGEPLRLSASPLPPAFLALFALPPQRSAQLPHRALPISIDAHSRGWNSA